MSPVLILKKNAGFYSIPLFEAYGFRAIFTDRGHDMSFEAASRRAAYKKIGIDGTHLVCPSQVHADGLFVVRQKHRGRGAYERRTAIAATDALITHQKQTPVAVLTADCLPVFVADVKNKVIAMIHAGWKSAHKGLIAKTITKMRVSFSSSSADLIVVLGPAIRSCCYEVGKEFFDYFPGCVCRRNDKIYFDIAQAASVQLKSQGVPAQNIYDSRICTSCANQEFFSYRKEGASAGRGMSLCEII